MNTSLDKETGVVGLGLTPQEAITSMKFYIERRGKLSAERLARRKRMHAWLPKSNMIHVSGVGAILYENNKFINLRTGVEIQVLHKPMAHYLCLFNAFSGYLSFEDFTLTIAPEINMFLNGISKIYMTLDDFPYIKPVESLKSKYLHITTIKDVVVVETSVNTLVVMDGDFSKEVDKVVGVSTDCLLAYLFASMGFFYDGKSLRRADEDRDNL